MDRTNTCSRKRAIMAQKGVGAYLQVSFARAEQPLLKGSQPLSLVWQPWRVGPLVRDQCFSCCCYEGSVRVVKLQNACKPDCFEDAAQVQNFPFAKPQAGMSATVNRTSVLRLNIWEAIEAAKDNVARANTGTHAEQATHRSTQPSNAACINSVASCRRRRWFWHR